MRASTLVGLAIALFLGAVAVVAVKTSGLLDRAAPPVAVKEEPVMVLVAKRTIYEGIAATSADVMLRPASEAERQQILQNKPKLMPPYVEAPNYRVAARTIPVDELLYKSDFLDAAIPESVSKRLSPGMRSVNVSLPPDEAASGLLRIGEYVDVYLTTTMCNDAKCTSPRTATAPLAMHLKIVVKRDNLWTVMAPVAENKPVSYILEANPYRAALIELAKTKGSISLLPTTNNVKNPAVMASMDDTARVASLLTGETSVNDQDLERIFNVRPAQTPEPPMAIEHYEGVKYTGTTIMDKMYGRPQANRNGPIMFTTPAAASKMNPSVDCPTCGKK